MTKAPITQVESPFSLGTLNAAGVSLEDANWFSRKPQSEQFLLLQRSSRAGAILAKLREFINTQGTQVAS